MAMRSEVARIVAACALCTAFVGVCTGEQTILFPLADATLYQPTSNGLQLSGGASDGLFVGVTGQQTIRRSLLQFDVAGAVPAGSVIISAHIEINVAQTQTGPNDMTVHRVLASWGEGSTIAPGGGGNGGAAQAGDATWGFRFFPDQPWSQVGGDFDPAVLSTVELDLVGPYVINGLGAAVQSMLDLPESNHGFMFIGRETGGTSSKRINSREAGVASARPRLVIDFTPPCPADWNLDGGIDGDDVIAFFQDWDAGVGDIDESGGTDGDDVIFFFALWDASCQ